MKKYFLILFFAAGLCGCSSSEVTIPESGKKADAYARGFIERITTLQPEEAIGMLAPELVNDSSKKLISELSGNISGVEVLNIRPVEYQSGMNPAGADGVPHFRISYEYSFSKGNILFLTVVREQGGQLSMAGFNFQPLSQPLSEITKLDFEEKGAKHYAFFAGFAANLIFVIVTLMSVLRSKISVKKKIFWVFAAVFVAFPQILFNWHTGESWVNFLSVGFSSGFSRPNLYTPWLIKFSIPVGAIIYWITKAVRKQPYAEKLKEM
jgi:hypothetical protein